MRTVLFGQILDAISKRAGWGPVVDIDPSRRGKIIEFINGRMGEAWEWDYWPELIRTENRAYRDTWVITYPYMAGDEKYNAYDETYYTCLMGNTGVRPDTDTDKWEVLDVTDKYIGYEQYDQTFIGHVLAVYTRNPRTSSKPGLLAHGVSENGIQLSGMAPNFPWITFRIRVAVFGNDEFDATYDYVATNVVYDPVTGNCFQALQTTAGGEYWGLVEFPYIFRRYIVRAVYSDILLDEGKIDQAAYQETKAEGFLMDTQDIEIGSQGLYNNVSVEAY